MAMRMYASFAFLSAIAVVVASALHASDGEGVESPPRRRGVMRGQRRVPGALEGERRERSFLSEEHEDDEKDRFRLLGKDSKLKKSEKNTTPDDSGYNTPDSRYWPSEKTWERELSSRLSSEASLNGPFIEDKGEKYLRECVSLGPFSYLLAAGGDGVCLQSAKCAHEFCDIDEDIALPAYVADVRTPQDISAAIEFASQYKIPVSVKTTGHSASGSSTAKDSLMIWMYNYPKDGTILTDYENSCGTNHDAVVTINGGETWNDVLEAVKGDYHIVSGGCRSVSAAGGWLMGCGLSGSGRRYGLGIDQVIDFDLVLANGTLVEKIDACSHPDLFWALRGGGGGTFGVVTRIHYKLHPVTPIIDVSWGISGFPSREQRDKFQYQWLKKWIEISTTLDNRWSGSFNPQGVDLTFSGTKADAKTSFLDDFDDWYNNVLDKDEFDGWGAPLPSSTVTEYDSWYESKGGAAAYYSFSTLSSGPFSYLLEGTAARLVPVEVAVEQPEDLLQVLLKWANSGLIPSLVANYFLGGAINDVPDDETAVNPAMRRAAFAVHSDDPVANDIIREFLPNNVTGVSFNHHYALEPDWRNALWGANYDRLADLKEKYDPNHVFNCWHCVGYQGEELVK